MGFARVPKPGSWSPLARDCPHPLSYAPATLKRPTKDGEKNMTRLLHLLALPLGLIATAWSTRVAAQSIVPNLEKEIRQRASQIESKLIAWRRDIHQYPELAEQETRTAALVAEHLKKLGLEVRTGVARTGVIAILKGGKPGPVVALRADMDALPVKEPEGLPFASKAKGKYLGREVDVMHACGHDAHTAILMATAEMLSALKDKLPGAVKFIFQPAEEGPSLYPPFAGKIWGARAMIKEGALQDPKPDAIFGLHVSASLPSGRIGYRPGAAMASADDLRIKVIGRQGHAGYPWRTIDTVTIRTFDAGVRASVHRDIRQITESIAASANAKAEVEIIELYDALVNNESLTARMMPVLERAADGDAILNQRLGASEDFSFYLNEIPGMFFQVGIVPRDQDPSTAAPNHSPNFFIDEKALVVGVRAFAMLTINYLAAGKAD